MSPWRPQFPLDLSLLSETLHPEVHPQAPHLVNAFFRLVWQPRQLSRGTGGTFPVPGMWQVIQEPVRANLSLQVKTRHNPGKPEPHLWPLNDLRQKASELIFVMYKRE